MKTAKMIKRLNGWTGSAVLFELSEPVEYDDEPWIEKERPEKRTRYVIVSAACALTGPETYIFPATPEGEPLDFGELPGSYRGGLNHDQALNDAGFSVQ